MRNNFKNKVVLVSGSTRGIGKEVARQFACLGAKVMITGRSQESIDEAVRYFVDEKLEVEGFVCDVSCWKSCEEMVQKIVDKHKSVDILVNNAGITRDNLLLRMSNEDWQTVMDINLKGSFHLTKLVSKIMLKARAGRIINIASIIGITGNPGQTNYAASKAGLIGFTKSVALELASRGITANAIAPGYIETDMTAKLNPKSREDLLNKIPLKQLGAVEDVAKVCLFLASDSANYITGQTLVVDGGLAL